MENKKYRSSFDKIFYIPWLIVFIVLVPITIISFEELIPGLIMLGTDTFTFYFLFSSLVAYVEFKDEVLFIKFGFFLKKEIPYSKIRDVVKERKFYSVSMMAIKNSLNHLNIKYNKFDIVTVSLKDEEEFIYELKRRIKK